MQDLPPENRAQCRKETVRWGYESVEVDAATPSGPKTLWFELRP